MLFSQLEPEDSIPSGNTCDLLVIGQRVQSRGRNRKVGKKIGGAASGSHPSRRQAQIHTALARCVAVEAAALNQWNIDFHGGVLKTVPILPKDWVSIIASIITQITNPKSQITNHKSRCPGTAESRLRPCQGRTASLPPRVVSSRVRRDAGYCLRPSGPRQTG